MEKVYVLEEVDTRDYDIVSRIVGIYKSFDSAINSALNEIKKYCLNHKECYEKVMETLRIEKPGDNIERAVLDADLIYFWYISPFKLED